jgi:hypothetical protein
LQELSSSNQPQKDSPDRNSPLNFKYKMNILDKIIVDKKEEKSFSKSIHSWFLNPEASCLFKRLYPHENFKNSTTGIIAEHKASPTIKGRDKL